MGSDGNFTKTYPSSQLLRLRRSGRSLFALFSLLVLFLLAYNGATIFCLQVPFPAKTRPGLISLIPEVDTGEKRKGSSSSVLYAIKEENPTPSIAKTHLPVLLRSKKLVLPTNDSSINMPKPGRKHKSMLKILRSEERSKQFLARVKEFLGANSSNNSCKVRFFMTWISSLDSFGDRELLVIGSLFKSHPNGCLIIVSNSMDSRRGMRVLKPFLDKHFRVIAVSPDFNYLFKNTAAEAWFDGLKKGTVDPGEISLGQNLSNLLRLALLYKFGGVYMDTDVLVLKSFTKLRNAIGAQTTDAETGTWTRLNNAVMIFDKGHPLLYKFIEEFALTFNGNKWGHNGPYLVSRVVSKVKRNPRFDFKVLPPMAFYPVDWSRIDGLFLAPINEAHSKWLRGKLRQIRRQSFAVHLWNRQSRRHKVEKGSIISDILSDCCVFCNSSSSAL